MEYKISEQDTIRFLECDRLGGLIMDEPEALDLIGACGADHVDSLLFYSDNLPQAFFNLKTGHAGRIMLKFSNYRIKVAVVIPADLTDKGHFAEMVMETNRGNQFRIFPTREAALNWILKVNRPYER